MEPWGSQFQIAPLIQWIWGSAEKAQTKIGASNKLKDLTFQTGCLVSFVELQLTDKGVKIYSVNEGTWNDNMTTCLAVILWLFLGSYRYWAGWVYGFCALMSERAQRLNQQWFWFKTSQKPLQGQGLKSHPADWWSKGPTRDTLYTSWVTIHYNTPGDVIYMKSRNRMNPPYIAQSCLYTSIHCSKYVIDHLKVIKRRNLHFTRQWNKFFFSYFPRGQKYMYWIKYKFGSKKTHNGPKVQSL